MIRLIIGLGNPQRRYRMTRHNIGFLVVEEVGRRRGAQAAKEEADCLVNRAVEGGGELVLARPLLMMNRSGRAVRPLVERLAVGPAQILVVCDDLHLELGALRLRRKGSHGGHNGLRSIIDALGSREFPRLRVGIGPAPEGMDHAEFVLARFAGNERARLDEVVALAADCVEAATREGVEPTMSRYNRRPGAPPGDSPTAE